MWHVSLEINRLKFKNWVKKLIKENLGNKCGVNPSISCIQIMLSIRFSFGALLCAFLKITQGKSFLLSFKCNALSII